MAEHSRSHDYLKLRRGYPPELYEKLLSLTGILWGIGTGNGSMSKDIEEKLTRELGEVLPGSITEIYDCHLWTGKMS